MFCFDRQCDLARQVSAMLLLLQTGTFKLHPPLFFGFLLHFQLSLLELAILLHLGFSWGFSVNQHFVMFFRSLLCIPPPYATTHTNILVPNVAILPHPRMQTSCPPSALLLTSFSVCSTLFYFQIFFHGSCSLFLL